jgi:hypothetical protein
MEGDEVTRRIEEAIGGNVGYLAEIEYLQGGGMEEYEPVGERRGTVVRRRSAFGG